MKLIKITFVLFAIVLAATSCVEKSAKYQTLLAQRDSLMVIDGNYHQTLDILNEVEAGFQAIRDTENAISAQVQRAEGQSVSQKQQLAEQLMQIKAILKQNKEKIAELQTRLAMSGKNNKALTETLQRLDAELANKTTLVKSLQEELSKKNIKIEELAGAITGLNTDVANLTEVSAVQQATIATQDQDLNTVWYIVGTTKELKDNKIVSGNGLFRAKTVMDKEFDRTVFVQTDLRSLKTIATNSKHPKVLSSHPQDSYKLVTGEDKIVTIEVINPTKFWSISKFLVIQK